MTAKNKYLLTAGLVIIGLITYRFLTFPGKLDAQSFKEIYKPGEAAELDLYVTQCEDENKRNLKFPPGEVDNAIVNSGFFSFDHPIQKKNIPRIVALLNDTSTYIWGEVGTFLPGKKIVFYDKENKPLGITDIDINNFCTYSYPYLRRMKWGSLTEKASEELKNLIAE